MSSSEKDSAGSPSGAPDADGDAAAAAQGSAAGPKKNSASPDDGGGEGASPAARAAAVDKEADQGAGSGAGASTSGGDGGNGGDAVAAAAEEDDDEGEIVVDSVTTPVPGGKRSLRGKVWRRNGECLRYRCEEAGEEYNPGDAVYVDSESPDLPYHICVIQSLKMSKRDAVSVNIKWFYRTSEVPEQVYQLLIQDRHTEHYGTTASTRSKVDIAAMNDPIYRSRELFISEKVEGKPYSVSMLRGKCKVHHCLDIRAVKEFVPEEDTFFYTLSYNSETRRLASTQGEIRVGASHQALLPPFEGDSTPVERRPEPTGEDLTWSPERIHDHDLLMFLRAARSMAAFAAMYDGGSPEDGFQAASRDGITAHAIDKLHESDYDTGAALQALLKANPFPTHDVFRKWPEEDVKSFIKGLRMHGKNFFRIREDFLPERDTPELVEFYYFWKKTSGATGTRPRKRGNRVMNVMRKVMKTGSSKQSKTKEDPEDLSSCSEVEEPEEDEEEEDDDEEEEGDEKGGKDKAENNDDGEDGGDEDEGEDDKGGNSNKGKRKKAKKKRKKKENGEAEVSPYYCRHCYTSTSRDWHHAGPDRLLVCTDCRLYFKRYAELPSLDGEVRKRDFTEDEVEEEKRRQQETEAGASAAKRRREAEVAGEINLSLIEQDSKADGSIHPAANLLLNHHRGAAAAAAAAAAGASGAGAAGLTEPVEIKAEVPNKNAPGIFSPVATLASSSPSQTAAATASAPSSASATSAVGSLVVSQAATEVYGSSRNPVSTSSIASSSSSSSEVEVLGEQRRHHPPPHHAPHPLPTGVPPREPSPPPKPDGSECHRSQSAIFTRLWNRGEGNSCSRTDMVFKPVPDSKLARKREERLRKASEREAEALKAEHAKRAAQEMASLQHMAGVPGHPGLFNPAAAAAAMAAAEQQYRAVGATPPASLHAALAAAARHPSPFPPAPPPVSSAAAAPPSRTAPPPGAPPSAAAGSPSPAPAPPPPRPIFPPGFAPAPPPSPHPSLASIQAAERRRLEEMAAAQQRVSAERQYAERMALATDPLVRLQMAGVTPEIPGASHFRHPGAFGLLGAPPGLRPPGPPPPPGLDPRFAPRPGSSAAAAAAAADLLLRPPPPPSHSSAAAASAAAANYLASTEMLQRQMILEREQTLLAAAAHQSAAQQSLLQQQEEFFRLEQEARARQANARP